MNRKQPARAQRPQFQHEEPHDMQQAGTSRDADPNAWSHSPATPMGMAAQASDSVDALASYLGMDALKLRRDLLRCLLKTVDGGALIKCFLTNPGNIPAALMCAGASLDLAGALECVLSGMDQTEDGNF